MAGLTHFDAGGRAHMVDVTDKAPIVRPWNEPLKETKPFLSL